MSFAVVDVMCVAYVFMHVSTYVLYDDSLSSVRDVIVCKLNVNDMAFFFLPLSLFTSIDLHILAVRVLILENPTNWIK